MKNQQQQTDVIDRDSDIVCYITAQPGYFVLEVAYSAGNSATYGNEHYQTDKQPVLAWAIREVGRPYPVTPYGTLDDGPIPFLQYPDGRVSDCGLSQTWSCTAAWLEDQGGKNE